MAIGKQESTARDWPYSAGVSSQWDWFVLATPEAVFLTESNESVQELASPIVCFSEGTIEFGLPEAVIEDPTLRLTIASGGWDPGAETLEVVDLAFNHRHLETTTTGFRSEAQRAAIDSGDLDGFFADVSFLTLQSGTVEPLPSEPGIYDRVYRSCQDLGLGYGAVFPTYRGRWQPYILYIPDSYRHGQPAPLILMLHALGQTHFQYLAGGFLPQIGGELGALVITPLALGTDGWYWDEALVDTLDAWVDVDGHYSVDRDQVYVTGYSMGGYGTYRLTTLFPELLAAAVTWVGPPAYQYWPYPSEPIPTGARQQPGKTTEMVENVAYVPTYIIAGSADMLVPVSGVDYHASRYAALGYEYRYAQHEEMGHLVYPSHNDYSRERDWLSGRQRVIDPPQVILRIRPGAWVTSDRPPDEQTAILGHLRELLTELSGHLDGAYWVSSVVTTVTGDAFSTVDLTSQGKAARVPIVTPIGPDTITGFGNPAYPGTTYVLRGNDRAFDLAPVENRLAGSLNGVSELTVDLDRAGLSYVDLDFDISVDREVTLRLISGETEHIVMLSP
jgi:predicted esterase